MVFQKDLEHKIEKNYLMTKLNFITKEYKVTFDLYVAEFGSGWQNVVHFTKGGNMGVYGDRTPGVWLSDDGLLHVASAVNDYLGGWNITTPLVAGKWFNLEISQLLSNSKVL